MKNVLNRFTALFAVVVVMLSAMPYALSAPYAHYTDKNGTKTTVDDSLSESYDLKNTPLSPLPKISYQLHGCDALAELDKDGKTIEVTLLNWEKYIEDIRCRVQVYNYENTGKTINVQDVPVCFVAPNGTFKMYTDENGNADFEVSRSEIERAVPTETPTPVSTPTPTPKVTPTPTPMPTNTPSVNYTPQPVKTPIATNAPKVTETPAATQKPSATTAPTVTETPSATKTPTTTSKPDATKIPVVTEAPVEKENGQKTTVDEYGNKHIVNDNGSETFIYTNGKKIVYDSSFLRAYDINDDQNNPLPKARFLALRCSMDVKRDERAGLITLTLSDYDKDLFEYVSLPEIIVCEIRLSRDKQFWNTPISGVPVRFVTPDGTFDKKTDGAGSASFTKSRPGVTAAPAATATPKPTVKPTSTPKPTVKPTSTPEPTKTPKPTVTPKPTKAPAPTSEPYVTEAPEVISREESRFRDVSASHWAISNINRITELGAFSGYEDGTFRPDNQITHEEFLKVVMSLIYDDEFDAMPENYVYLADNDTSSHNYWTNRYAAWAQPYLTAALDIGVIEESDYDIGAAETPITRGEMAKIISRVMYYLGEGQSADSDASADISDWNTIAQDYRSFVADVYSKGIISGYSDGSFGSANNLTRAETSAVVIRLIDKNQRTTKH